MSPDKLNDGGPYQTKVKDTFGYKKQGLAGLSHQLQPIEQMRNIRCSERFATGGRWDVRPGWIEDKKHERTRASGRWRICCRAWCGDLAVNAADGPTGRIHGPPGPDFVDRPSQGAPIVEVRLPEQLSPEATIGQRAFEAKCASCHGANAAGQNGAAPPLIHRTYEPSHHSDEAFQLAVRNGVRAHHWPFGNMPPVEGLTRADVRYIARYIREVQRENGIN